jgi:CRP-like cAMP-binding protein
MSKLHNVAELLSFEPGQVLYRQDSPADRFYLVRMMYVKVRH